MSCSFIRFVLLISFVVVVYRIRYMRSEKRISIFIFLVYSFVVSIRLLIISPNLIRVLLGWDGLGLISYCLVIYYQNIKSYNAGMLTAMSNRIGDVMILLSIAWILNFGRWNYLFYFSFDQGLYGIIGVLIILAAITKRAQIPFSSWLPSAIAAPTPVSALVHSSTLVTAGVYLLIRFNFIFTNLSLCIFLLTVSVLTIFMSGLGAIFEHDLKKVIALSTLSQLGLIIRRLCLGIVEVAFFHLITHALFKSLLFICAGYIIHGINNSQDIRFIGCVIRHRPLLRIYFNISNLSLCGMPFLAGFYSKDLILETILMETNNLIIFILYFISIFFTVTYTFRLIYFRITSVTNGTGYHQFSDNDFIILRWIMVIIVMVLVGGCFMRWLIFIDLEGIILPFLLKTCTLLLCIFGGLWGILIGINRLISKKMSGNIFLKRLLGEIWFLPYLCSYRINWMALKRGYIYYKVIDSGWGEFIGGQGLFNVLINLNSQISYLQMKNLFITMFIYIIILIFVTFMFLYLNSLFRA